MARTDADKVRWILETDLETVDIDAYIEGATALIDREFENKGVSETLLENIERWLTAHMIAATRERQAIEQKAGPAEQKFTDVYHRGLDSTSYGQMAMALDPTGTLFDLSMQRRPIKLYAVKT